jgi:hypothetical protein
VAALLAVPFAVLSALAVAFFGLIALAFSNGEFQDGGWLVVTLPVLLAVWLLGGAVLLLLGRSWLAVFLPAVALVVVVVWAVLAAGLGEDTGGLLVVLWGLPGVTALLVALPVVRRWIATRKLARLTRD